MKSLFRYIVPLIMRLLPETRCFGFKRWLLRQTGARIGKNVRICSSAMFIGSGHLVIGDNTWIGHRCLISTSSTIIIGANCDIAPCVYIGNGTHLIAPDGDRIAGAGICGDIVIGDGCWLCAGCIILPGVVIGNKCAVAAGAVVTKPCNENLVLVAGIPAVVKKHFRD